MIDFSEDTELVTNIKNVVAGKDRPKFISMNGAIFSTELIRKAIRLCPNPINAYIIEEKVCISNYDYRHGRYFESCLQRDDGSEIKAPTFVIVWPDGKAGFKSEAAVAARQAYYQAIVDQKKADKEAERAQKKLEREERKAAAAAKREAKARRIAEKLPKKEPSAKLPPKTETVAPKIRSNYRDKWKS
jgi:hypothetical protein